MAFKYEPGKHPEKFAPFPVKFKTPQGEKGVINVTFKYRTRSGYASYMQELYAVEAEKPIDVENIDFVELFAKGGEKTICHLMKALDSWSLEIPMNKETLLEMQDCLPAAVSAMGEAYRTACVEGKLGN